MVFAVNWLSAKFHPQKALANFSLYKLEKRMHEKTMLDTCKG